jgi:hypothetical protein
MTRCGKCPQCGYGPTLLERIACWIFGKDTHRCDHEGE